MSRRRSSKSGKIISAKVHDTKVPEIPKEQKKVYDGKKYHKFGTDNLFPQAIASLNRKSPVHRGILNNKTIYTSGKGFNYDESNTSLEEIIKKANNKESLRAVLKKVIFDKYAFGNGFMEIVTDARRSFVSFFHQDSTKCRLARFEDAVIIHPDWSNEHNYIADQIKVIPMYPNFIEEDGVQRSIVQFKSYEPEFNYYGVPSWMSAMDAVAIGYKTNKWNVSRLDNAFQTSGVLLVDGDMSAEDAQELQEDFSNNFTGEGNQGKILMLIKQLGKSEGTQFIPINEGSEGDWLNLHQQSSDDLIIAHSWYRSLSGIADNTGFDTNRILNEYQIAESTVLSEEQANYLDTLNMILSDFGIDASSLEFINKPPINVGSLINIDKVVTIGEARSALGLNVDEDDTTMDNYIEI